jgi:hypothetical protein
LYVIKAFSVQHEAGIQGFPQGKKVTLVKEEGNFLVVTDGSINGSAPRDSFTRDLDVVDKVRQALVSAQQQAAQQQQQALSESKEEETRQRQEEASQDYEKKRLGLQDAIDHQEFALQTLQNRISLARRERSDKGYPSDGGTRYVRDGVARFLSPDAAGIRELIQAELRLERRIGELKLAMECHLRGAHKP